MLKNNTSEENQRALNLLSIRNDFLIKKQDSIEIKMSYVFWTIYHRDYVTFIVLNTFWNFTNYFDIILNSLL